ncbi:BspA family leucine-rich repeat surface protein [Niabella sp.]|uniref:BspA family leucine-rich repeat surface protein n=1 Tax=Niabella sp. TaxID=1962976 RepID=UPI00260A86AD|nr:BspA family leucine-rich repeat surface protein [Niabella sp.]
MQGTVKKIARAGTAGDAAAFITIWKTDNPGSTASNQIAVPGTGSYTVQWDCLTDPCSGGMLTARGNMVITFPLPGIYRLRMKAQRSTAYFGFDFNYPLLKAGDQQKLTGVEQWGINRWRVLNFSGCINLDITAADLPDFSALTSARNMFFDCSSLLGNSSFQHWDMSRVCDLSFMFFEASSFDQPLGRWNLRSVQPSKTGGLQYMLHNTGLSRRHYEATLAAWAVNAGTPDDMVLGALNLKYADAFGRNLLTRKGWLINGDIYVPAGHVDVNRIRYEALGYDGSGR